MFTLRPKDQVKEGAILRAYSSEDFFWAESSVSPEALPRLLETC